MYGAGRDELVRLDLSWLSVSGFDLAVVAVALALGSPQAGRLLSVGASHGCCQCSSLLHPGRPLRPWFSLQRGLALTPTFPVWTRTLPR